MLEMLNNTRQNYVLSSTEVDCKVSQLFGPQPAQSGSSAALDIRFRNTSADDGQCDIYPATSADSKTASVSNLSGILIQANSDSMSSVNPDSSKDSTPQQSRNSDGSTSSQLQRKSRGCMF